MTPTSPITILLAEDHTVFREGLRALLEIEADMSIIGEASHGTEAVEMARKLKPSVVVLDIAMPRCNGIEASRLIRAEAPETKVLILSAHGDDAYVDAVVAAGAVGYLVKQTSALELVQAIRTVHRGETCFSPRVGLRYRKRHRTRLDRKGQKQSAALQLTAREMEVFQQIAEGEPNKGIADSLGISIKTVEKHRASLMRKLDLHNTADLTRHAIETGVIESSVQLTIEE